LNCDELAVVEVAVVVLFRAEVVVVVAVVDGLDLLVEIEDDEEVEEELPVVPTSIDSFW